MTQRLPLSNYSRMVRVILAAELVALLAVGRWMMLADQEPPVPPQVSAAACRGCKAEDRIMERWNRTHPSDRWQCRSQGAGWEEVESCLDLAATERTKDYVWRLN